MKEQETEYYSSPYLQGTAQVHQQPCYRLLPYYLPQLSIPEYREMKSKNRLLQLYEIMPGKIICSYTYLHIRQGLFNPCLFKNCLFQPFFKSFSVIRNNGLFISIFIDHFNTCKYVYQYTNT